MAHEPVHEDESEARLLVNEYWDAMTGGGPELCNPVYHSRPSGSHASTRTVRQRAPFSILDFWASRRYHALQCLPHAIETSERRARRPLRARDEEGLLIFGTKT